MNDADAADDEAHLAALIAVLTLTRADGTVNATLTGTPLQQWRTRRLAALSRDADRPTPRR
jgi:hypothetical protein